MRWNESIGGILLLAVAGCSQARDTAPEAVSRVNEAIIGGQSVSGATDFPGQMVAIVEQIVDSTTGKVTNHGIECGGTLINPQFVLTAAHCFTSEIGGAVTDFSNYRVVVSNTTYPNGGVADIQGISGVFREPGWRITPGKDIALVRLNSPLTGVTPTKLPTGAPTGLVQGSTVNAFGWGSTVAPPANGSYPGTLQKVALSYFAQGDACKAFDDAFTNPTDPRHNSLDSIAPTELCIGRAAGDTTAKGNCFADSGGPIMYFDGTNNVQVGIVAHGAPNTTCGDEVPDVYTSVADNLPFINTVLAGKRADFDGDGVQESTVWLAEGQSDLELFYQFDAGNSPLGAGFATSFGPIDTGIPVLYARANGGYLSGLSIGHQDADASDDVLITVGGLKAQYLGSSLGSFEAFNQEMSAFPSADRDDGRFFALASSGLATVNRTYASFYIGVPAPLALPFSVHVFDAGLTGFWDKPVTGLKTCMRLFPDKLMNGPDDDVDGSGAPIAPLYTVSVDDTEPDDTWKALTSVTPGASAFNGSGWGFRFEIYLAAAADSCDLGPKGQTIPDGVINGFKVGVDNRRAVMKLSDTEFSFMAVDSTGPYTPHTASFIQWKDTNYNGFFSFPFYVGSETNEGRFINADADDQDHPSPASALGKNHEVNYRIFAFREHAHGFFPASEYPTETAKGRPSGGYRPNEGFQNGDQEQLQLSLSPFGDGGTAYHSPASGTWLWDKINDSNIVHLFIPRGSPQHLEYVAGGLGWAPVSAAMGPLAWRASAGLSSRLPIPMGVPGSQVISIATASQAQLLLDAATPRDGSNPLATDRLKGALLAAKLNIKVASERSEDLGSAQLYGTTLVASQVITHGDALVGMGAGAPAAELTDVAGQLAALNAGQVTYISLPSDNTGDLDPDADGVITNRDNCPATPNVAQTDSDRNGIGDACEPTPFVRCVVKRASDYLAVFGYTNSYAERRITPGVNNAFSPGASNRGQPGVQKFGGDSYAVTVPFTGSVTWTLAGKTATATSASTACGGFDVTHVGFGSNVALYASGDLRVDDRVALLGASTIANAGPGLTDIGASANVGDVLSTPDVTLRSSAVANALVKTVGVVNLQAGAQLFGGKLEHAAFSLPALSYSVTFPAATAGDIALEPGAPVRLAAPGSYGAVVLKNNTQLVLSAGTYYMTSLDLEPGSSLKLNQSAGSVTIYVKNSIIYRSVITVQGGGTPNLLLGYFGTNAAFIETAFTGAVIAPNAQLVLGPTSGGANYVGTFFGKSIEARPDTHYQFALFGP